MRENYDRSEFFNDWPEGQFLLQLHRSENACKKLVKLCGHGDPTENARRSYVSLRKGSLKILSQCSSL